MGAGALGFFAVTACDNAKDDVIDNGVYILEAATSTSSMETLPKEIGGTLETSVGVRLAKAAANDVTVSLALDNAALQSYNARNSAAYELIPAGQVSFPSTATIKAGEITVNVPITVTAWEGEPGVEYAVALSITNAEGMRISEGSKSYVIGLSKILEQKVPGFIYNNHMSFAPEGDWGMNLTAYTIEWWNRCTSPNDPTRGFRVNNQAIFNFKHDGSHECYIRFGDLVYGSGVFNFLQIKFLGVDANYDTGDPNQGKGLKAGEWDHFAHTYDATTGEFKLYRNGQLVNSGSVAPGNLYPLNGLEMCSSGATYFIDVFEVCQVRLWKTARSQSQIVNNMRKEVRYTDPDLILYCPMNEGEGDVLHDVTGNGHDLVIGNVGGNHEAKSWTEYSF